MARHFAVTLAEVSRVVFRVRNPAPLSRSSNALSRRPRPAFHTEDSGAIDRHARGRRTLETRRDTPVARRQYAPARAEPACPALAALAKAELAGVTTVTSYHYCVLFEIVEPSQILVSRFETLEGRFVIPRRLQRKSSNVVQDLRPSQIARARDQVPRSRTRASR